VENVLKKVENNMAMIPEVVNTFDKLKALHNLKNSDYAPQGDPFFNFSFQEWFSKHYDNARDKVFAIMISVKFARLSVLLNKNGEPNNESIEDSFDDAIVYTTLWKADYMRRVAKKEPMSQTAIENANTR
jgi:hypothetical protein